MNKLFYHKYYTEVVSYNFLPAFTTMPYLWQSYKKCSIYLLHGIKKAPRFPFSFFFSPVLSFLVSVNILEPKA